MENEVVIGIHPDQIGGESYSDKWAEFLGKRDVKVIILDLLARDALEQAQQCDGVMWRWTHNPNHKQSAQRILYTIENCMGIPVFPDSRTAWHYDEKVAQFYLLQALDVPTPRTWVFWDRIQALEWAGKIQYPIIFKLSAGAGSSNVLKVKNEEDAITLINRSFERGIFPYTMNEFKISSGLPHTVGQIKDKLNRLKDAFNFFWKYEYPSLPPFWWKPEYGYIYFQEFLPDNDFDTRITIIGNRAFGFRRYNRPGDFRASGSGNIDFDNKKIDRRCIQIAFKISELGMFQSMAYDFLYRQGQPVICEISYTYADWAVHNCPGHWNHELNWIDGQMWPEEAQAEDFLMRINANRLVA